MQAAPAKCPSVGRQRIRSGTPQPCTAASTRRSLLDCASLYGRLRALKYPTKFTAFPPSELRFGDSFRRKHCAPNLKADRVRVGAVDQSGWPAICVQHDTSIYLTGVFFHPLGLWPVICFMAVNADVMVISPLKGALGCVQLSVLALWGATALWADVCRTLPTAPSDARVSRAGPFWPTDSPPQPVSYQLSVRDGGPTFRITIKVLPIRPDEGTGFGRSEAAHAGDIEVSRCRDGKRLQSLPFEAWQPLILAIRSKLVILTSTDIATFLCSPIMPESFIAAPTGCMTRPPAFSCRTS